MDKNEKKYSKDACTFSDMVFLRSPYFSFEGYCLPKLAEILKLEMFRNALWLASPEFYYVLEIKHFDFMQLSDKEQFTLQKYYNRMSFRPVPFGAFASFATAGWSDDEYATLSPPSSSTMHLLPSREWIVQQVATKTHDNRELLYTTNPTLYEFSRTLRYFKSERGKSGKFEFSTYALPAEKINLQLLNHGKEDFIGYQQLINLLMAQADCSAEEASEYLDFLISEQFFLSDADMGLLESREPLNLQPSADFWKKAASLGLNGELKAMVTEMESQLESGLTRKDKKYFYAALQRPLAAGGIARGVQDQILKTVHVVRKIVKPNNSAAMQQFVNSFKSKFDQQRVPLLTALDPDAGVGYGNLENLTKSDFLDGISFPQLADERQINWTEIHQLFLNLWLLNNKRSFYDPLSLTAIDVESIPENDIRDSLPPSFTVFFRKLDEQLLIESLGGISATSLLGRFSVFSEEVHAHCQKLAQKESASNPDIIFAEIHQLSDDHADNINRRKQIYPYVIPVMPSPGLHHENTIPLNDLVLYVRRDELYMESKRLGKRIIPRLPTAYNFSRNTLTVFRFLCDMQYQHINANLSFDLEKLFPGLTFYPRVVIEECIVNQARWILTENEVRSLTERPFSLGRLHAYRQHRQIPASVVAGLADQQLVFDLTDDNEAFFFLNYLASLKQVTIQEYLLSGRELRQGKQAYAAQYMAFLENNETVYKKLPVQGNAQGQKTRTFSLGSEWLYLKIYCTPPAADTILEQVVHPLVKSCKDIITSWFFIRYKDPQTHLRLRIRAAQEHIARLLIAFQNMSTEPGVGELIREYQGDHYQRELERYHPELIEDVEALFHMGSEMTLALLANRIDGQLQKNEFLMALCLVYTMALSFLSSFEITAIFLEAMKNSFLQEFKGESQLTVELDGKYRQLKKELDAMLKDDQHIGDMQTVFGTRFPDFLKCLVDIAVKARQQIDVNAHILLADLVHMQVNRLFHARQRHYEAAMYYMLAKYCRSQSGRQKANA